MKTTPHIGLSEPNRYYWIPSGDFWAILDRHDQGSKLPMGTCLTELAARTMCESLNREAAESVSPNGRYTERGAA